MVSPPVKNVHEFGRLFSGKNISGGVRETPYTIQKLLGTTLS